MAMAGETTAAAFTWRSAAVTTQGNVRKHNEDAILELPGIGLWAVADGMGGHKAGDVASRMVVEALGAVSRLEVVSELVDDIEDRLRAVNEHLYKTSLEGGGGMSGSTVVVLLALERHCLSLWAGDSRIYRLREGTLAAVTRDHSEVQAMLDEGLLKPESAEQHNSLNVITRAVGGSQELYLDVELRPLQHQDRYLLCSDGLYKELSEADLARHLASNDPNGACKALLKQALSGACTDNVSAIAVQFSAA
jgi:serine/threonine protein phosphatase PrpC